MHAEQPVHDHGDQEQRQARLDLLRLADFLRSGSSDSLHLRESVS